LGENLIGDVADATGLPSELISKELCTLLEKAGIHPTQTTLEDLRAILAEYVQDILLEAKANYSDGHEGSSVK
jgi:hypothetical protein